MMELVEKPKETGIVPVSDPEKNKWRLGLSSMQQRWSAILQTNLNQFPHDITFSFGQEKVTCHKFVLSAASSIFEVLIAQASKLGEDVIEVPEVNAIAFKQLLQQIYERNVKKFEEDSLGSIFWSEQQKLVNNEETRFSHDVEFLVGEEKEKITCHKFIVSVGSAVFESVINNNAEQPIELPDAIPTGFRKVIQHIYQDANLKIADEELVATMKTAFKFEIPELQNQCSERLQKILSKDNAVTILQEAIDVKDTVLRDKAREFLLNHFETVFDSDDFLQFKKENLQEFIKDDSLVVYSEVELFKAVVRWAESQVLTVQKELSVKEVIEHLVHDIRLPTISLKEFVSIQETSNLLNPQDLIQLLKYFLQRKENTNFSLTELNFPTALRKCTSNDIIVNLISGLTLYSEITTVGTIRLFQFEFTGTSVPIFLKGIGFAGRPSKSTELVRYHCSVTSLTKQNETLHEFVTNYTAEANKIHTIEFSNSVKMEHGVTFRINLTLLAGGFGVWMGGLPNEIIVYQPPNDSTNVIKIKNTCSHNVLYTLKFSHCE